jgi:thiol-disulfide isomerase/thioredoxin
MYIKKLLLVLAVLGLVFYFFIGCLPTTPGGTGGTEGEGEQETSDRVVMVELFVAPTCSRCPAAKIAINSLSNKYGLDQMIILEEYGWDDPYGIYTGWYTLEIFNRFKWYNNSTNTPDAYFNGLSQNVPYNEFSLFTYKTAIEAELARPPKVSISASYGVTDLIVSISGQINNISSEILENLVIGAMVYEDLVPLGTSTANHVVRDIITSEQIDSFSDGGSLSFSLESEYLINVIDMDNIHVVVYVQMPGSPTKEILQALYLE